MRKFGFIAAGVLCFALYGGETLFTRSVEEQPDLASLRSKVAKRVLMYPEIQYKYGLFQNFLSGYIDRPLFFDRATRYKTGYKYQTSESFFKDALIRQSYGFDGGGSLCSAIFNSYIEVLDWLEKEPDRLKNYYEFPQFSFGESGKYKIEKENTARVLRRALKSGFAPKINGRIPISTYNSYYIQPEVMKSHLNSLRKEFGDTFAVTGGLAVDPGDYEIYHKNGKWDQNIRKKYEQRIDSILDTFDGIQLVSTGERRQLNRYQTEADFKVYDREILPLLIKALSKPGNKNKLVCGHAQHGYINHMSGVNFGEFGTKTLRGLLNRFAKINCDFIFFFEWNEFNENTCWQPTLYNSLVLQRLVRYYANIMRGEKPVPNKGDDLNIPPLALSHRETLRAGEILEFELLNIPDTAEKSSYYAQLCLEDLQGRKIITFPKEQFDRAKLRAVTYQVPTEKISVQTVLIPKLVVSGKNGKEIRFDNFQYVRVMPTFCYNYKTVRQTIRDLLKPVSAELKVTATGNNHYQLTGVVEADEELASVEITDFGREVYAVDPSGEFDRNKYMVITGNFSTRRNGSRPVQITVKNGGNWKFRGWDFPNVSIGSFTRKGESLNGHFLLWSELNRFMITIPIENSGKSEIIVTVDGETHTFKCSDLIKRNYIARAFPKCRLELQNYHALCDIPYQLKEKRASFKVNIKSNRSYPIYQLRAVTVSGKIFRSVPIVPTAIPQKTEMLNVHSETTGNAVAVPVISALVPRLNWVFDPVAGDVIDNNGFDPYFRCDLGGGYNYCNAFNRMPVPPGRHAPKWLKEGNETVLSFDGSTYLHFPVETFPRGSFKLKMEVKPEPGDANSYMLFRHFDRIVGSITVATRYDHLYFAFLDKNVKLTTFSSGLELTPNQWSKLEISYDLHKVKIRVNGKSREFPMENKRALYFKPAIFGGHTKPEFGGLPDTEMFKGKLRAFSIEHNI